VMHRIDFVISNDRHHCAMAQPLARLMMDRGPFQIRVLSLCEFRGITTPQNPLALEGVRLVTLARIRRPRGLKAKPRGSKPQGMFTKVAQALAWLVLLSGNVKRAFVSRPDLVILFNDAAYPYDRICRFLRKRKIPFLLIQEGIRFEAAESAIEGALNQGKGGATAIAAFGESSAEFFSKQGAPRQSIHLTGNPRFDELSSLDFQSKMRQLRRELNLGGRNLLFLSNPIEFHGYCSRERKLRLVRDFVLGLDPLFEDEEFRLVFKLHGQENPGDFLAAANASLHMSQIVMASDCELYPLLSLSDAAVIFGTTAGLEALLLGVPLGVIEIPGVGFLHDYVREGAAVPLRWNTPMSEQVTQLLALKGRYQPSVDRYLDRALASRSDATERIFELVNSLLPAHSPQVGTLSA